MKIDKKPGIYIIKNIINNKTYIGQSKNVNKRFIHHKSMLRSNNHANPYLQKSWNKHGENNFVFEILEYCEVHELTLKEKFYLSLQLSSYNLRDVIDSVIHPKRKYCKISAEKISKANKGKIPKNLKEIQKARRRKIIYYIDNNIIKIFNSCVEAADYFKITPNSFTNYIGKQEKENKIYKSKYFGLNYKLRYDE